MAVNRFSLWHFSRARVLAALFFVAAFAGTNPRAAAQETPPLPAAAADASTRAAISITPSVPAEKAAMPAPATAPRVLANGGAPLFWAEGIARAAELDDYAATGMTAVVVRLSWRASASGDAFDATDFALPRAFAEAAARRNLRIIYQFPAAPSGGLEGLRIAGDNEAYAHLWESYIGAAIDALKTTPNLAGWMLPADPRALKTASEAGFARWIAANYADVRTLNAQWLTRFGSLDDVTMAAAGQVADAWKKRKDAATPETRADAPDTVWPFHPAALALSQYRLDAYRALISRWARTVKNLDKSQPLFSGALPDYAQLLALPPQVDVSVPAVFPGVAENDFQTHNPQAVDVARRGNRFRAVAMLSTFASTRNGAPPDSAGLPPDALAGLLPFWCRESLLHGASGLAFSSWDGLLQNPSARAALQATLRDLQSPQWRDLWKTPPIATTAVVLTPLADGYTRAAENPRGLYGFGENLVFGEPSNLVYELRHGSSFGGVDFLAPEDVDFDSTSNATEAFLPNAAPQYSLDEKPVASIFSAPREGAVKRTPLSRYGALLLPQALSVSPQLSDALGKYATGGGIVVADLGFGALQNGGRVLAMPEALAKLFGVARGVALAEMSFNLRAGETSELLPAWSREIEGALRGSFLTLGGNRGAAFSGAALLSGALPAGTVQLGFAPPPRDLNPGDVGVSLSLKPRGAGALIYAPFFLWRDWRPEHFGFAALHGDLMLRRATLLQSSAPAIVPAPGPLAGAVPLSPEVVDYGDAILLINHLPPLPQPPANAASTRSAPAAAPPSGFSPAAFSTASRDEIVRSSGTISSQRAVSLSVTTFAAPDALASTRVSLRMAPPIFAARTREKTDVASRLFTAPRNARGEDISDFGAASAPPFWAALFDGGSFGRATESEEKSLPSRRAAAPLLVAAKKKTPRENPLPKPLPVTPATSSVTTITPVTPPEVAPAAPQLKPPPPGLMFSAIQTAAPSDFLWNDALCVFDAASTRAPLSFFVTRPLPVAAALAGEVPAANVTLHSKVSAAQTQRLGMLPVRAQNLDGGSLVARVTAFGSNRAEIVLWPNALGIAPDGDDFAVTSGVDPAALQITIYDSPGGYRVRPNSRHRIVAAELGAPLLPGGKRESATDTVTADALGRLVINAGGTAPIIEVTPLP